jgi:hypothetical protein|tara:strand:- start:10 stop:225 length:216 start_codon:yes stop_codon:yes gene_type:complete
LDSEVCKISGISPSIGKYKDIDSGPSTANITTKTSSLRIISFEEEFIEFLLSPRHLIGKNTTIWRRSLEYG